MIKKPGGYEAGNPKDYDLRPCPYCGDDIPRYNKHGRRRTASQYAVITTCGKDVCRGAAVKDPQGRPASGTSKKIFKPDMGVYGLFI